MAPADVTVVDMKTGKAPRMPDRDNPSSNDYVEAMRNFTALHQETIAEALKYIPNVLVSVNVDLDTVAQSREQDPRVELKLYDDLVTGPVTTRAFYVRFLLPIWFDIQCQEFEAGTEPERSWNFA